MQGYRQKCRKFRFVNSAPAERGTRTAQAGSPFPGGTFFSTDHAGCTNCVSVFAPNGRHLFLHRLSGVLEPRRRFTLTGGEFFAEPQQGFAVCGRRERRRAPRQGQKGRDTCGFPSSLNSYLSLVCQSDANQRPATASKNRNGSRVTSACLSPPFRSSQTAYCYTYGLLYAGAT